MLSDKIKQEFRLFAEKLAIQAGNILISKKKDFIIKKVKDLQQLDIATSADYASEEYIIAQIKKYYPNHGIIAEESGISKSDMSDFNWVIDPLDGTKEYAKGIPYYYILIALEYKNTPIMGIAYQPETKYMFSTDIKTFSNSHTILVSKEKTLSKTFISVRLPSLSSSPLIRPKIFTVMSRLCEAVYKIRSTQWDAESLAYTAMGAYDAYVSITSKEDIAHHKWWDVAPGILMVKNAGGKVTDLDGKPITDKTLPNGIVASNGLIHDQLLKIIQKVK